MNFVKNLVTNFVTKLVAKLVTNSVTNLVNHQIGWWVLWCIWWYILWQIWWQIIFTKFSDEIVIEFIGKYIESPNVVVCFVIKLDTNSDKHLIWWSREEFVEKLCDQIGHSELILQFICWPKDPGDLRGKCKKKRRKKPNKC